MIYAIGDIHGAFDKLNRLYCMIITDIDRFKIERATIIFLGDYVDRGPEPKKVLDFLMDLEDTDKIQHIFLKGNHEDMMVNNYYRDGHVDMWVTNGGRETLDAFECVTPEDFYGNPKLEKYIIWCKKLPLLYIIGKYAFVHGGYDPKQLPGNQHPNVLLWKRSTPYMLGKEYDDCIFTVVHGHTPHAEPQKFRNEINVDTFACYNGKLTAARLPEDITAYNKNELDRMHPKAVDLIINEKITFLNA
jgi:serine/threonine protein phosphatase 1